MAQPRILALVLAGGKGSRMDVLTAARAKPAIPYAGVYRLIDFPLSNCVHSGISDVWVVEQFEPHALNDHLANGRPWDLDRTYGGLRIIPPYEGHGEGGWHRGNADAIYHQRRFIRELNPDLILVLSSDHIYTLDYRRVVDAHLDNGADVTMVTTEVPIEQAGRFGTVEVDRDGKVTAFDYKPETPRSNIVTTEVFVYHAQVLLQTLDELAQAGSEDDDEPALKDFGHQLLPHLVSAGRAYAFPLEGYWRDVGVVESYWESHMDLLDPETALDLARIDWPILTYGFQRMPARIHGTARIERSLVSPGCHIHGHVVNSILSPGVVVEEGAVVRDSILFHDTRVAAGATVERAIVDREVQIGANAQVGVQETNGSPPEITLIGERMEIPAGARIAAGERVGGEQGRDGS